MMHKRPVFDLGLEMHTFTAIGRCPRSGRLGISVTTSEIATGGRVPSIKPNVGAVATQAYTDPRLGGLGIQLLELGYPAPRVLAELRASDPYVEWRQTGVIDRWGHVAVHTGELNNQWTGHRTGGGYVNRCVNDIRRRPSQPLIQWRFHPHTVHRDRRLRSTQGPSDA